MALLLGAQSGTVISDQSTNSIIFRIMGNICREVEGGNITASNLYHPATYDSAQILAQRHNLEYRFAELDPESGPVPMDAVLKHIDRDTLALSMIHASSITGTKNNGQEIINAARAVNPDLFVLIDGAQQVCHRVIDVEQYGADAWVFVPYKTYSKLGTIFAHLSDRLANLSHEKFLGKKRISGISGPENRKRSPPCRNWSNTTSGWARSTPTTRTDEPESWQR